MKSSSFHQTLIQLSLELCIRIREKRGSGLVISNYKVILEAIHTSEIMQNHWRRYQKDFEYAKDISFEDTCISVKNLMKQLFESN